MLLVDCYTIVTNQVNINFMYNDPMFVTENFNKKYAK